MQRLFIIGVIVLSGLFCGAAPAGAAPPDAGERIVLAANNGSVSLDEAIRKVRRQYGDITVLKAETKGQGERAEHRIKFLTAEGRVRTVRVSARNGKIR